MEDDKKINILEKAKEIYSIGKSKSGVKKFLDGENVPEARQERIIEMLEDEIGPDEDESNWKIVLGVILFIIAILRLISLFVRL